jgi:hypothetical protein
MATTTTRARRPAKKTVAAAPKPEVPKVELTDEQRQAKIQAYASLKGANLPIPKEISTDVEGWIKEENARRAAEEKVIKASQKETEAENKKGPWYVRNLYPAPQSIRLDRQTEKRRIELKPRGVPGDLHPLLEGDLEDPILKLNLGQGLIEVIPAGEAKLIIDKQVTNVQNRQHTPISILRNERGEAYGEGSVKVEAEFNSQGVTVASIDPGVLQGRYSDSQVARADGGISRTVSGFVPTGGNPAIISDGFNPNPNDPNAAAKIADDIARRRGAGGIEAGIGGLQVVVNPTQRG